MKSFILFFLITLNTVTSDSYYDDYEELTLEPPTRTSVTLSEPLHEMAKVDEPVFFPCEEKGSEVPVNCGRVWREGGRVLFHDQVKMDKSDPVKLHDNGTLEIRFPEAGFYVVECEVDCLTVSRNFVTHYVEVESEEDDYIWSAACVSNGKGDVLLNVLVVLIATILRFV